MIRHFSCFVSSGDTAVGLVLTEKKTIFSEGALDYVDCMSRFVSMQQQKA